MSEDVLEPPASDSAEQGVLGVLLHNNGVYSRLPALTKDHFNNPVHAKLYSDISDIIERGNTADPITLKSKYDVEEFEKIGGADYLSELVFHAPSDQVAPDYAKLLIDLATRRQTISECKHAIENLSDPDLINVLPILDDHISAVVRLQRQGTGQQSFSSTSDAVAALFSPDRPSKIDTGWKSLDEKAGFVRGGITLIGGRASMGKSAFAIEAAFNAARRGLRVDFFSMEMNKTQIAARAISSYLARTSDVNGLPNGIDYQDIFEHNLSQGQWERVRKAAQELPTINFDDTPRLNVSDIKARCIDKPGQLDLVVIDYLNIMDLSDCKQADRHDQKLGLACSRLRDFAKDTGAAVALLCQLNRGNIQRENNVPQLHDLRDSGELEQHADTVFFVHRQHYYEDRKLEAKEAAGEEVTNEEKATVEALKHYFDVMIAKQRMGQTGRAHLRCHMNFNYIGDIRK